ncbi:uncharacterized protein LOC135823234 isoform X2 [Sycon ciliatum]|uniref:uncharacterized protein LOC135823234 isoform X2 n=1 Tax=Sycon ciliatum TaxID=27933 RepID=UPI0031F6A78A
MGALISRIDSLKISVNWYREKEAGRKHLYEYISELNTRSSSILDANGCHLLFGVKATPKCQQTVGNHCQCYQCPSASYQCPSLASASTSTSASQRDAAAAADDDADCVHQRHAADGAAGADCVSAGGAIRGMGVVSTPSNLQPPPASEVTTSTEAASTQDVPTSADTRSRPCTPSSSSTAPSPSPLATASAAVTTRSDLNGSSQHGSSSNHSDCSASSNVLPPWNRILCDKVHHSSGEIRDSRLLILDEFLRLRYLILEHSSLVLETDDVMKTVDTLCSNISSSLGSAGESVCCVCCSHRVDVLLPCMHAYCSPCISQCKTSLQSSYIIWLRRQQKHWSEDPLF